MRATWHADACGPALVAGQATFSCIVGEQIYAIMSRRMLLKVIGHLEYKGASTPGWVMADGTCYPWCLDPNKEEVL